MTLLRGLWLRLSSRCPLRKRYTWIISWRMMSTSSSCGILGSRWIRLLMLTSLWFGKVIPEHLVCELDHWMVKECSSSPKYTRLYSAYIAVRSGGGSLRQVGRLAGGRPKAWRSGFHSAWCVFLDDRMTALP